MEDIHACIECAYKHISKARSLYNEAANGYRDFDHVGYIIGEMSAAEDHLIAFYPKWAEEIRKERLGFWASVLEVEEVLYRPEFDSILYMIYEEILNAEEKE